MLSISAITSAKASGRSGGDQVDGHMFLVENYDPISALSYWRHGELDPADPA